MESPQIRPGLVEERPAMSKVVAFFRNSAEGNLAIQLLVAHGIPSDRIGVTPPEQIEGGQGMLLSVGCPAVAMINQVETVCRKHGAEIHRQRR